MPRAEHCCVRWLNGWWYGRVYTVDSATGQEREVYRSLAYTTKADAAVAALSEWRFRNAKAKEDGRAQRGAGEQGGSVPSQV